MLVLSEVESQELLERLRAQTGLSALTVRVCLQRGLSSVEAIQAFLSPKLEQLTSPFLIQDMQRAMDLMSGAGLVGVGGLRETRQPVLVFGDYDVDGTAGAALLVWVLREMGFVVSATQPDRFKDGYGLNVAAVEVAVASGVGLLITVDCGITSFQALERAQELGLAVIVIDHHQVDPKRGIPPAGAVINPQRADCLSGLKQLCGCGLAFYFAIALRMTGRALQWFAQGAEPNLKQHLDLVVMATAADMVPLTGDNHILVRYGMQVLKNSQKPGVKALLKAAGLVSRDFSSSFLGFVIAPRINASGRMASASLALELLTTHDSERAEELAASLENLNQERSRVQLAIWDELRVQVDQGIAKGLYAHAIVIASRDWHEGVLGIVASRVTEWYRRPAIVISLSQHTVGSGGGNEAGEQAPVVGKGSVRSYGGKDVLQALRECEGYLLGFGGHRFAAGLSLKGERLAEFQEAFNAACGALEYEAQAGSLTIEGACQLQDLQVPTLLELERLGPFGPGNPEPVFAVQAAISQQRVLKGRHLKLSLTAEEQGLATTERFVGQTLCQDQLPHLQHGQTSAQPTIQTIEAIWFNVAENAETMRDLAASQLQEWAGVPELNRFRGQLTPSFRVRAWRALEIGERKKSAQDIRHQT